ncbi:MAG: AAA family ATPase [Alphaproteobacteria bacterium]|nr:AAA family ATPase [Alphaproteobacteria bacterium]
MKTNSPNMTADLEAVIDAVLLSVRDKRPQIELALAAFLSGGHVLIEDAPGTGKTSLARALGHHLSLERKRLQCTNDTMPSDILGVNIFDPQTGSFTFRRGPLFSQLILVDELNRAPSKSQSALLEAMAERQASIDGVRYDLPDPFILIATQNPAEHIGVSPLPESQLDRFAVSFSLGLPSPQTEADILMQAQAGIESDLSQPPILAKGDFQHLCTLCQTVQTNASVIAYLQKLANHIRAALFPNLSVRALMQIKNLAQARAFIKGRDYTVPEDIQTVLIGALRHRLPLEANETEARIPELIAEIDVP